MYTRKTRKEKKIALQKSSLIILRPLLVVPSELEEMI